MENRNWKFETRKTKLETKTVTATGPNPEKSRLKTAFQLVWNFFRELSGENDYARYHAWTLAQGLTPMSQKAFYLSHLQQKYSRPNRCC